MSKIMFCFLSALIVLSCKSPQPKEFRYNMMLGNELQNVIVNYLQDDRNSYLNPIQHCLVVAIQKSNNQIVSTNQFQSSIVSNDKNFGVAHTTNFTILLYGDPVGKWYTLSGAIPR